MKSPELRKELSELCLHKRGIRINLQLSLIESEDEIRVRSKAEIAQRIHALASLLHWQENGPAALAAQQNSAAQPFFSARERAQAARPADAAAGVNSAEALRFLLWSCGLLPAIGMPDGKSPAPDVCALLSA